MARSRESSPAKTPRHRQALRVRDDSDVFTTARSVHQTLDQLTRARSSLKTFGRIRAIVQYSAMCNSATLMNTMLRQLVDFATNATSTDNMCTFAVCSALEKWPDRARGLAGLWRITYCAKNVNVRLECAMVLYCMMLESRSRMRRSRGLLRVWTYDESPRMRRFAAQILSDEESRR